MKNSVLILFSILITCVSCKNEDRVVTAMTYNIRLDVASDGENAWPNRKEFLSSQILFHSPDVLGVQEAQPNQMEDLENQLKNYKVIGVGREGGNKGEHSSIFYNADKLEVENEATFWLSETPEKPSMGWDAACERICTYGLFTSLSTDEKFWVFNTHLDHIGNVARLNGMKFILNKISEVNTENYPVLVMGDFNVESNSELIANLKKSMWDSESISSLIFGPRGTFNGFRFEEIPTRKIDYIFLSKTESLKVNKYAVLSNTQNLKYPSDHFPVYIEFTIE